MNDSIDTIHHLPASVDKIFSAALMCVFATRAFIHINTKLFDHADLQRDFYQPFMQGQFHFFEHFIDALMAVPVCQIAVGSYFSKPFR